MRSKHRMSPSTRRKRLLKRIHIRSFSIKNSLFAIDSQNGRSLDNSQEVADNFLNDRAGLEEYYDNKKESIKAAYIEDSNNGAIDGVPASELDSWLDQRNELLQELDYQLEDIKDLADIPLGSGSPDASSLNPFEDAESASQNPSQDAESSSQNPSQDAESSSQNPALPQNSSDVHQTEFNSFEPFGEE